MSSKEFTYMDAKLYCKSSSLMAWCITAQTAVQYWNPGLSQEMRNGTFSLSPWVPVKRDQ